MNELVVDAFEFCKRGQRREGNLSMSDLSRLAAETADGAGRIKWALQGGRSEAGYPELVLSIAGSVSLLCQRCLAPLHFDIESVSTLILAADEGSADELDELYADDEAEVIVGSVSMNIRELIEDEALLAIPLSPRHAACIDSQVPDGPEKPSPFAVLKNLKH